MMSNLVLIFELIEVLFSAKCPPGSLPDLLLALPCVRVVPRDELSPGLELLLRPELPANFRISCHYSGSDSDLILIPGENKSFGRKVCGTLARSPHNDARNATVPRAPAERKQACGSCVQAEASLRAAKARATAQFGDSWPGAEHCEPTRLKMEEIRIGRK